MGLCVLGWRTWRKEIEEKEGKGYIFNVYKWKIHPRGQGGHPKKESRVPRTLVPVIFTGQGRKLLFSKVAWLLEMKVINTLSKHTVRKYISLCFFGWALWLSQSGSEWPGTEDTAKLGTNNCIHHRHFTLSCDLCKALPLACFYLAVCCKQWMGVHYSLELQEA